MFIMKKQKRFFKNALFIAFSFFIASSSLLFSGCKQKDNISTVQKTFSQSVREIKIDSKNHIASDAIKEFFALDYSPEYPDSVLVKNENNSKEENSSVKKSSEKKTESVVPEIRKLSDYSTEYSTQKARLAEYKIEDESEEEAENSEGEFFVEDWGPQGKIVSEESNPVFYVIFSKPLVSLKALDVPSSVSDVMTIEPPLKGTFRWYGTKHLSFEAQEAADPCLEYTIKINPELTSKSGKKISGETVFKTKAEGIKIVNIWGGYIEKSDQAYKNNSGALPPYENRSVIRINAVTKAETLSKNLSVFAGEKEIKNIKITPVYQDIFSYWRSKTSSVEEEKRSNTFLIEIEEDLPHNTDVKFQTEGNGEKSSRKYRTLQNLKVVRFPENTEYTRGKKAFPWTITFNQDIDKNSVLGKITIPGIKIGEENIEVNGPCITIFNLPFDYKTKYTVKISKDIKDIYGQSLSKDFSKELSTQNALSYVKFLSYGTTMMEAQFPHKLLIEHQNSKGGSYTIGKTKRPLGSGEYFYNIADKNFADENTYTVEKGKPNERKFEEIDLDPYLDEGFGFVRFKSDMTYERYVSWEEKFEDYTDKNSAAIQVTDLGLTVRLGINKAVAMVRSLSSGKAVKNADVFIVEDMTKIKDGKKALRVFEYDNKNSKDFIIASGKTDDNGFCVIEYTADEMTKMLATDPYVFVINGKDKAVFRPESHNAYSAGIWPSSMQSVRESVQRTFMFVDRGVYRPGETVTFRGIDRDQALGTFISYEGKYKITSSESRWNAEDIIEPIRGKTSSSGGFYGSFKLPDNLEAGTYEIKYSRNEEPSWSDPSITFTVANFQRVKFESSISVPQITFIGGDKIYASLSANYLAGGSLKEADYETKWYKSAVAFSPKNPLTKGYTFDSRAYEGRNHFNDSKGKLDSLGKASMSVKSEKITNGSTYAYHLESSVTDLSNQKITAQTDFLVHPAQFYIGLKKSSGSSSFSKKGRPVNFDYILTNPSGEILKSKDLSLMVAEISYKLTHKDWTLVHEQSVNGNIYTRYDEKEITDLTEKVKAGTKGEISLTPKECGWHTLTLEGKDKRGNKVISKIDFYVTGGSSSWYDRYDSQSINLTPDQSQYNPGEKAKVLLESPLPSGDYLITVEREGIFTEEIRHIDSTESIIEIPVARNYVPVVYVSVASYSERHGTPDYQYGEVDLDKPKGYYGVTEIFVNPYVKSFTVQIECDKPSYRPGETATIKFKASKGGKPCEGAELTAMAVDRGVLDLINYHVPNPIDFFYNKNNFPLCVRGGDSRALLMDPVTYSVKNLQGGDADEEKENERKDFRPTAFFEPVLITDENGEASVTFKVPDSLTAYRITAFGVKEDLFALQEDEVKVQNPVNVQQVQPHMLRERDTAECGVLITNLGKDGLDVTVNLEVISPAEDTEEDKAEGRKTIPGKAFVDGQNSHKVYVASGDSSVVYFDLAAVSEGTVNLVYTINSSVLNEKLVSPIKIEKTFVYETVTMTGSSSKDKKSKEKESFIIPGFAKEGKGNISFTLDATRLGLLSSSVNYLFEYPYNCLEQQSSRVMPLIAFDEYIDVFGMDSKIGNPQKFVKFLTKKWKDYQRNDGGFGYWSDSQNSDFYVTLRIAHIYALALSRGYSAKDIPIDIEKAKAFLKEKLDEKREKYQKSNENTSYDNPTFNNDYLESYACYVFALLKDQSLSSYAENLYKKTDELALDSLAYLSLAFNENGNMEKAKECAEKIRPYLQPDQRSVSITEKIRSNYDFWYRNESLELAVILQSFVSLNAEDEMVDRLLYTLLSKQSQGRWQSTITSAKVLESIYAYIKNRSLDDTDFTAEVSVNGKKMMEEKFKGVGSKPKTLTLPFEDEFISELPKDKEIPLVFEKNGEGYLFYTLEMKYAIPDERQAERDQGIKVIYTIKDAESGEIMNSEKETNEVFLEEGKMYKASIVLESPRNHDYLALRSPIPSGAEIIDPALPINGTASVSSSWESWLSHYSIKDNEVDFFYNKLYSGKTSAEFTFRAVHRGIYPTPPVQAECMYEEEIFGRSNGYLFIIR